MLPNSSFTSATRTPMLIAVQAGGIFVNQEALRQLRRRFTEAQIPEDEMEAWLRVAEEFTVLKD